MGSDRWRTRRDRGRTRLRHRGDGLRDRGIPLVVTLAGGYGEPIETTADIQARSVTLAAERG